ncbi:MAG: glycosyltransferase [Candidatus Paceibacterota bacterium]|jgi:glycosyltransferase involved in cell wall biosynthesis
MKILHLIPTYFPAQKAMGPIAPTHFLNKELVRRGVEVTVYTTNLDGFDMLSVPTGEPIIIDGVKVYYFSTVFRSWYYSPEMCKMISKTIGNFDLVHITSVFLAISYFGSRYSLKNNKPYIISPHGSLMKEPLRMKSAHKKRLYLSCIEGRALFRAAAIHFTTTQEKEEYNAQHLPLAHSFVIPNSFDPSEFDREIASPTHGEFRKKFKIAPEKKIILSLGRLNWKKGFDTLIPALSKIVVDIPEAILVIAGDDNENYGKEIKKLIHFYNVDNHVMFVGLVSGAMRIGAFRESNVFVLPSYSENFGMAIIEAMYCELPVVVTEGVGISKDILSARAGHIIKKNEKELADSVVELLNNSEGAHKMGERGKKLVQSEFAIEGVAQNMYDEYNKLIEKYGNSSKK